MVTFFKERSNIYAVLSVLFWSTAATAFKLTLEYIDHVSMLLFSCMVSFLFFLILVLMRGPNKLFSLPRKNVLYSLMLGLLNPFLYYLLLFKGYDVLPAQEALVLNYTWPFVIAVLSVPILKHKLSGRSIFALILGFVGTVLIITKGTFELKFTSYYFLYPLSSAFIWGIYWLLNVKNKIDDVYKLFFNFLSGSVAVFLFMLIGSRKIELNLYGLLGSSYNGLFEMGLTFFIWLNALKYCKKASSISVLIFLSPFISLLIISAVLKETIMSSTFIGLILIFSGILLEKAHIKMKKTVLN